MMLYEIKKFKIYFWYIMVDNNDVDNVITLSILLMAFMHVENTGLYYRNMKSLIESTPK